MPAKVVDASVLGAIAFGEPAAGEALGLIGEAQVYAPQLLAYELASMASKKARRAPHLRAAISVALEAALQADIRWFDVDHPRALSLALDTGLTTYDAAYLWLAQQLRVPLVTFDERLERVARGG